MILSARNNKTDITAEFMVRQIVAKIKQIRQEKKINQEEVAAELGISPQAYGQIENGRNTFKVVHLLQITDAIKTPLDKILELLPSDAVIESLESEIYQLNEQSKNDSKRIKDLELLVDFLKEKLAKAKEP